MFSNLSEDLLKISGVQLILYPEVLPINDVVSAILIDDDQYHLLGECLSQTIEDVKKAEQLGDSKAGLLDILHSVNIPESCDISILASLKELYQVWQGDWTELRYKALGEKISLAINVQRVLKPKQRPSVANAFRQVVENRYSPKMWQAVESRIDQLLSEIKHTTKFTDEHKFMLMHEIGNIIYPEVPVKYGDCGLLYLHASRDPSPLYQKIMAS